jgi:SRSO17 transposase
MDVSGGGRWIVEDTGFRKKGKHSVGVGRQYWDEPAQQENRQVAVSVSLACGKGSVLEAWQL